MRSINSVMPLAKIRLLISLALITLANVAYAGELMAMVDRTTAAVNKNTKFQNVVMKNINPELFGMCSIVGIRALSYEDSGGKLSDASIEMAGGMLAISMYYKERMLAKGFSEKYFGNILDTYKAPLLLDAKSAQSADSKYIKACKTVFDKITAEIQ